MTTLESVTELGLFVAREFLPERLCTEVREHMVSARRTAGMILVDGREFVDVSARRTHTTFIPPSVQGVVGERIRAVLPDLVRHFGVAVTGLTEPQFLCYCMSRATSSRSIAIETTGEIAIPSTFEHVRSRS